jgi:PLP dependent protein
MTEDLMYIEDNNLTWMKQNYDHVLGRIDRAASISGRNPEDIRLVVVTKAQPVQKITAAINAGARIFGENYAEQAVPKINQFEGQSGIEWHMIGHIQSRKASLVCQHFDLIHSLDGLKLAQRLDRCASEFQKVMPVLLEFNLSSEQSKYGWKIYDGNLRSELLEEIEHILALSHLRIQGLMTMPPLFEDPGLVRPYFAKLREIREELSKIFPETNWKELSMGTSADFEIAIQEGATLVRVGQAILGGRQ